MVQQEIFKANGESLAIYLPASSWQSGLTFLTQTSDAIQAGIWRFNQGTKLQPHIHNEVIRSISRTQEVIFIKNGRLGAQIYNDENKLIKKLEMRTGDTLILLKGGHGYEILEDNTEVLEIKNGPYPGPELDRRRIE